MNLSTHIDPADKDAYVKAQKTRSLYIGLGLFVFVGLVFAVTMIRMSENMARERAQRAAATTQMSNAAPASKP